MTRHGTGACDGVGPATGDAGCGGGVGGVAAIGGQRTHGLTSSLAMGQPITVVEKRGPAGVVRFELNRSLTGMGHERYRSAAEASGDEPDAMLARRLFEHGGVEAVHVYSNVVTVHLAEGASAAGLLPVIEELFIHYREGVTPSLP